MCSNMFADSDDVYFLRIRGVNYEFTIFYAMGVGSHFCNRVRVGDFSCIYGVI